MLFFNEPISLMILISGSDAYSKATIVNDKEKKKIETMQYYL